MTPYSVMKDIAGFLKGKLKIENVYEGFLSKIDKIANVQKRCPSVAVRVVEVNDYKNSSTVQIAIYALTFDDDLIYGSCELYHILEKIRFEILTNNPIKNKYLIQMGETQAVTTYVPDEQFFPYWIGAIEFVVRISQPENKNSINVI